MRPRFQCLIILHLLPIKFNLFSPLLLNSLPISDRLLTELVYREYLGYVRLPKLVARISLDHLKERVLLNGLL